MTKSSGLARGPREWRAIMKRLGDAGGGIGPDRLVASEQGVVLETDPTKAREKLAVAEFRLAATKDEAAAIRSQGEGAAEVVDFKNQAEAAGLLLLRRAEALLLLRLRCGGLLRLRRGAGWIQTRIRIEASHQKSADSGLNRTR